MPLCKLQAAVVLINCTSARGMAATTAEQFSFIIGLPFLTLCTLRMYFHELNILHDMFYFTCLLYKFRFPVASSSFPTTPVGFRGIDALRLSVTLQTERVFNDWALIESLLKSAKRFPLLQQLQHQTNRSVAISFPCCRSMCMLSTCGMSSCYCVVLLSWLPFLTNQ